LRCGQGVSEACSATASAGLAAAEIRTGCTAALYRAPHQAAGHERSLKMQSRNMLAVAIAGLLTLAPAAAAHRGTTPESRACAHVAFTPQSDDMAANIRARGLTCGLARDFIRDSEGRPGDRFRGFRCASTEVENPEGLPYTRYRCTGAGDVIRWRRF